jgi:hypothetical protein
MPLSLTTEKLIQVAFNDSRGVGWGDGEKEKILDQSY